MSWLWAGFMLKPGAVLVDVVISLAVALAVFLCVVSLTLGARKHKHARAVKPGQVR
ncbi:hypothetical protein Rpal_3054 [Rhodopseudomonas palustris TIE-1]|uniref:hypothetical protein n=1 Tax=Rhodopseudomonas palustris TaxID=1076 RepID=UPI0001779773|nr:hypothetical protein [Rhodopseudomonas palustris]ACF01560.1 hypothetical protein Rpal_3054 [Rhodopseudomonas palustris TIE-1]